MTNRLADETSPYLQQHKHNPVDWYPWGDEPKKLAQKKDKPLFISIGYSTCHWCHVMARESFENVVTADYMNSQFVNIKMDREEYPGIDKAYQEMFQMLHQRGGGWPLSVWAHPDGTPFYIGTYFPDKPRHGMPSFMDVNKRLLHLWQNDRETLKTQGDRLANALDNIGKHWTRDENELSDDLYYKEIIGIQRRFDGKYGGIGGAPKFPRVETLRFLMREGLKRDLPDIVDFVSFTYHKMARGGIYDQLGGGFSRYSVDRMWLVPHFEKMLYDNAALIKLGAELVAATQDKFVDFIVRDTIAWMAREMRSPEGAFYAAQNAESEGREGAFFVWQLTEVQEILGSKSEIAIARYGLTKNGNFQDPHHPEISGMNVLSIDKSIDQLVEQFNKPREVIISELEEIRQALYFDRETREKPSTDTKILTSWNSLAIRGLLAAGQYLQYEEATQLAITALDFVIENMVDDGVVLRMYQRDREGSNVVEGILDDYSFLIAAMIDAYEVTDNFVYLENAADVLSWADTKFLDEEEGLYYLNPSHQEDLFKRIIQTTDDSMASGLGVMVYNLFKLGKYLERKELVERGEAIASKLSGFASNYPGGMSTLLNSASLYLHYPHEIVLVHPTSEIDKAVGSTYLYNKLIYRYDNNSQKPDWEVLQNRKQDKTTAYICRGQTCSLPLHTAEDVRQELSRQ